MKNQAIFLLLLLLISRLFAFDDLWQKTQEISSRSNNLIPGRSSITFDYTQTVRLTDFMVHWEAELIHELDATNQIRTSIESKKMTDNFNELKNQVIPISTLNEFRTTLDQFRKSFTDMVNGQANIDLTPKENGIFTENDRKILTVKRQKKLLQIGGITCVEYQINYKPKEKKDEQTKGKIWVHSETGVPVYAELQPLQSLLSMVPGLKPELQIYFDYDPDNNTYYPSRQVLNMIYNLPESTITMKTLSELSDYWFYHD